jgi:hypothetical protein
MMEGSRSESKSVPLAKGSGFREAQKITDSEHCLFTTYRIFVSLVNLGFGSGSNLGPVDPDPDSESGSGSRRAKMTHKSRKKF